MITQQPKKFKILLIGDNCQDVYQYGTVDRISPEAPVPVFKLNYQKTTSGMGSNVKNNLENLGCEVRYHHGDDSIKTRFIDTRSNQHLIRIDNDVISDSLDFNTITLLNSYDAVVISDYDKGFVSTDLIKQIRKNCNKPVFVDTKKKDLAQFEGCFVKINAHERSHATSFCTDLIITLGENGAEYQGTKFPPKKIEMVDVCGAGDTFLAALVYEYLNTENIAKGIEFAIKASAITVQHTGVYAPTLEEIQ